LLVNERVDEAAGFRHVAPTGVDDTTEVARPSTHQPARGRERWVINKVRALMSWYSKGLDGGSQLRVRVNSCDSLHQLTDFIDEFFAATVQIAR
jgi:tRNA-dihydrouridine synthase